MLLFNQHSEPDTDFERDFLRFSSLVADMDHIRHGVPPVTMAGDDAPLLDRWLLGNVLTPALVGLSTGHPALPGTNRPIATSQVFLMSADMSWARTLSRWYRLGRPAERSGLDA